MRGILVKCIADDETRDFGPGNLEFPSITLSSLRNHVLLMRVEIWVPYVELESKNNGSCKRRRF